MKINYTHRICGALLCLALLFAGCEKENDMVVDRIVSPVLVLVEGTQFLPDEPVSLTATVYELDKSGLLDHTVGIDSVPVANLSIVLMADGAPCADLSTDASGKVHIQKSWQELGFSAPASGNVVQLEWSGNHKGTAFTKLSRVQVK